MAGRPIVNPFATRHTRPAALAWLPQPDSLEELLDRLDRLGGRGVICGPHGSGKSTLLRALAAAAAERGWQPRMVFLSSVADLGRAVAAVTATAEPDQWLGIDSWEKLGMLGRPLAWLAARRGGRMVVTMHRQPEPGGWPVLLETRPAADTFRRLVRRLLDQAAIAPPLAARFEQDLLDQVFHRHRGNLREAFFDLYDHFEQFARD